jgi:phage small terminase subunit
MASPARLHKQREEARIASERAAERQETLQGSEHELALAQLAQHKRQLQGIQSLEARQAKKAELIQEWHGYIDGVLAADAGVPDPIISQMLPWLFDVGDIDRALTVGDYLLRHDLPAPEQFTRDLPSLYAEMAAESALNRPSSLSVEQLAEVLDATTGYDMVDEIRAKLYRALGEALHDEGNLEAAVTHLRRAVELNPKVGCKPLLAQLEKELAAQTPQAQENNAHT